VAESLRCIGDKNKTRFGLLRCNPGAISEDFFGRVRTVTPHFYSVFHPDPFRFGRDDPKNPSTTPQSECTIGSLSL